ncbi:hypothetical protein [Streptomyces sp. NPDC057438]|uniref:hypothetical protein n=1 Tax=Streptomyces sp. NPDC057438 TaxID=3346133 RepID=UPI0036A8CC77
MTDPTAGPAVALAVHRTAGAGGRAGVPVLGLNAAAAALGGRLGVSASSRHASCTGRSPPGWRVAFGRGWAVDSAVVLVGS